MSGSGLHGSSAAGSNIYFDTHSKALLKFFVVKILTGLINVGQTLDLVIFRAVRDLADRRPGLVQVSRLGGIAGGCLSLRTWAEGGRIPPK